jgi:Imidazoleglycerol-phosphate synthase
MSIRIIPRLDIKGPNLVKGIHLEGLRVLGKPEDFAKYYYENGADELMYQDVVASLYNRNSLSDIISQTAKEVFIPITVGGGIRNIDDMRRVLRAGADKVSLNTAAIKNPEIIKDAAHYFGSSTIVVSIEAIKQSNNEYMAYTDNGREYTGIEVISWAKKVEQLGAGEIIITSVDKEGTGLGFDYDLTKTISEIVSVPVVAHGGAGCVEDVLKVIQYSQADAVAISSILHYGVKPKDIQQFTKMYEGNIEYLKKGEKFSIINSVHIAELKKYLRDNRIDCRFTDLKYSGSN